MTIYLLIIILGAEIGVMFVIKYRMPEDPIWAKKRVITERDRKIKRAIIISVVGVVLVGVVYLLVLRPRFNIPYPFVVSLILTPLAYAGRVIKNEEEIIFRKDENFPAFIRSLSSSLAASGSSLIFVLKYLSAHDFGTLTKDIKALYRRLAVRVSNERGWDFFISETGSWLIGIFSEMFRESIRLGAEPDYVGKVISRNFERLVRLRRKRQQSLASFIGIIYGITGAFAFSVASSFQVAISISELFGRMQVSLEYIGDIIHVIEPSGLVFLTGIMLLLMIIHSLVSAITIKLADGGHIGISLYYFVILLWIFAVGMFIGQTLMERMMGLGSGILLVLLEGMP